MFGFSCGLRVWPCCRMPICTRQPSSFACSAGSNLCRFRRPRLVTSTVITFEHDLPRSGGQYRLMRAAVTSQPRIIGSSLRRCSCSSSVTHRCWLEAIAVHSSLSSPSGLSTEIELTARDPGLLRQRLPEVRMAQQAGGPDSGENPPGLRTARAAGHPCRRSRRRAETKSISVEAVGPASRIEFPWQQCGGRPQTAGRRGSSWSLPGPERARGTDRRGRFFIAPADTRLAAPARLSMNPSAASCSYTSDTVPLDIPRSAASERVDGNGTPAA